VTQDFLRRPADRTGSGNPQPQPHVGQIIPSRQRYAAHAKTRRRASETAVHARIIAPMHMRKATIWPIGPKLWPVQRYREYKRHRRPRGLSANDALRRISPVFRFNVRRACPCGRFSPWSKGEDDGEVRRLLQAGAVIGSHHDRLRRGWQLEFPIGKLFRSAQIRLLR
jgi:hypothetical protein